MKSIRCILAAVLLCLPAAECKADFSETIALDRYTLIDSATFQHDTGFLYLDGTFHVATSDIESYSLYGFTPDYLAPVSGKPLMDETLYSNYRSLNLIPKWIASSFDIAIGYETFVIVGVKGKDDAGPNIAITGQPQSARTLLGGSAFFSVQADPAHYLSYQWYCNRKALAGQTESSLLVINAKKAGVYKCAVSAGGTPVFSQGALLTVVTPATIKKQPSSVTATAGKKVTFRVVALGTRPLHYQWYMNVVGNGAIPDATNSTYTIASVRASDAGQYYVTVTNDMSFALSGLVTLSVVP